MRAERIAAGDRNIDDDILAPHAVADPYPMFARLRERAPVHYSERYRAWLVTGYAECHLAHTHPAISSDRITFVLRRLEAQGAEPQLLDVFRVLSGWMVFKDGAAHRRLRGLVSQAFTPRSVARMEVRVREIADGLLDELLDRPDGEGAIDLVAGIAYPLPAVVIAEMLGVPGEDRDRFKRWSDDIIGLVFSDLGDERRHQRAQAGMAELVRYLGAAVDRARRAPGADVPREDLVTRLVAAQEGRDALSDAEVIAMCTLLLFAGHETTTNLIASSLLALLRHPAQLERLRREPQLIESAVEEFLRYDGPARLSVRVVTEDLELGGRRLGRGERAFLVLAAANRDPAMFARPDELDIARDPNPHLGFGFGTHYCLGASLARLEGRTVIPRVLERLGRLELPDEELEWQPSLLSRSLKALRVRRAPA
jgi:cytochrome P450